MNSDCFSTFTLKFCELLLWATEIEGMTREWLTMSSIENQSFQQQKLSRYSFPLSFKTFFQFTFDFVGLIAQFYLLCFVIPPVSFWDRFFAGYLMRPKIKIVCTCLYQREEYIICAHGECRLWLTAHSDIEWTRLWTGYSILCSGSWFTVIP